MTTVEDKNDPYEKIIETMKKEYVNSIPLVDGDVSESFREFIKMLFTPEEAEVAQYLTTRPQGAGKIAKKIGKSRAETKKILDEMTYNGLLHDMGNGYSHFMIMAHLLNMGWKYKKTAERVGGIKAAQLWEQFFVDEKFYKHYTASKKGNTVNRVVPVNTAIHYESKVNTAEEIHGIIDECSEPIVATDCPCRSRQDTLGNVRECKDKFPIEETCLQVGAFGGYFARRNEGRVLTREEAHELIDKNAKMGLVFNTGNIMNPMFHQVICSCCACCCSVLKPITRYEDKFEHSIAKANYISKVDQELCKGFGLCAKRCPFEAITIEDEKAAVDAQKCYGCGVCAVTCPTEAIRLHRFERSHIFESGMQMMGQMKKDNQEN